MHRVLPPSSCRPSRSAFSACVQVASPAASSPSPSPAPTPGGPPEPPPLDRTRLGHAAVVAGLAQGGPLGVSFALCSLARAQGRPHLKVLGGFAPLVAALLTAPGEQALREALGAQPTLPATPSLTHDAIPGVVLFLATLAWQRLPGPARPPPTSAAGLAATVGISMLGSLAGGVLSEASAQGAPADPGTQPPVPAQHKAMGRALSLLPMAVWSQVPACLATAGRPLPRWSGLAGTGLACAGWTFRRVLTSPAPLQSPPDAFP